MTTLTMACLSMCLGAGPVPVILDTDLGDDIDDTWALAMVLGLEQLDLKLIVTATDDTDKKTRLVAKMLDRMGHTNIPIGTGIKSAGKDINQGKWLGDYDLRMYPGKVHQDGLQALIDTIMASDQTVALIVIGPQTNIKAALEREPRIATKAHVYSMAGSVRVGYNGKEKPAAEYNVVRDPAAMQAVFAAPWDITLAPLDVCGTLRLSGDRYQRVAEATTPRAKVTIENYEVWSNFDQYPAGTSSVLFDTVAVYLAMDEAYCELETLSLVVDDAGFTKENPKGRPVRCAMGWKDREAFEDLLVHSLAADISPKLSDQK